jgi:uncharacterized membrane protein
MISPDLGMSIAIVIGGLLLVMGLVFSVNAILSGGLVVWMVAGMCYYWRRERA